jgi:hypothetical protein
MKTKSEITNQQRSALGIKRTDNGEIEHADEKKTWSKENDNVRPDSSK